MIQYLILISSFGCIFSTPVPKSLDWRTKGAVLPVPDLGDCATPVIINALDAISAQNQIKGRELVRLSTQQIYDCGKNNLCPCKDGTSISQIYDLLWAEDLGDQIDSEESYPFTGKCTKQCNFKKSGAVVTMNAFTSCTDCIDPMNRTSEELLLGQLQNGPVPVQIQADTVSFQTYTGGILDDASCSGATLDFALLVVGYGTENGVDYWIARNSWGTKWGEQGYIRIVRGKFMCGIGKVWAQPFVQ